MVVRHEYENPSFDDNGEQTSVVDVKATLFDEEIDNNMGGICGLVVERTADGGLKFTHRGEDEFANQSKVEIVLTKIDLDRIKEFEQKGLL